MGVVLAGEVEGRLRFNPIGRRDFQTRNRSIVMRRMYVYTARKSMAVFRSFGWLFAVTSDTKMVMLHRDCAPSRTTRKYMDIVARVADGWDVDVVVTRDQAEVEAFLAGLTAKGLFNEWVQ